MCIDSLHLRFFQSICLYFHINKFLRNYTVSCYLIYDGGRWWDGHWGSGDAGTLTFGKNKSASLFTEAMYITYVQVTVVVVRTMNGDSLTMV